MLDIYLKRMFLLHELGSGNRIAGKTVDHQANACQLLTAQVPFLTAVASFPHRKSQSVGLPTRLAVQQSDSRHVNEMAGRAHHSVFPNAAKSACDRGLPIPNARKFCPISKWRRASFKKWVVFPGKLTSTQLKERKFCSISTTCFKVHTSREFLGAMLSTLLNTFFHTVVRLWWLLQLRCSKEATVAQKL